MITDNVKITGDVKLTLTGPDGAVKDEQHIKNLVVSAGKAFIASRMKDTTDDAMSHMAIGEDDTAANVADTALGNEAGRVALASTTVTSNSVEYIATFPAATGTGAIVEAGLFNDASAGTMLCRTVFAVINKGAADTISITWTVTIN